MGRRAVTVLGINDGHDAGAALIADGKVLAALQEERPRNIKHYNGTPMFAIKEVFRIANVHPSDVDVIAVAGLIKTQGPQSERPPHVRLYESLSPYISSHTLTKLYVKILKKFRKMKHLQKVFMELGIDQKEIVFVEHHLAHAACAYRSSPRSYETPVLILTADGAGDGLSSTVSVGEGGQIHRIAESTHYNSVGNVFYSEITRYLGLKPWDHEYKVMGLAPYGKPEFCINQIKKIINLNPKNQLEFQNRIWAYTSEVQPKLRKILAGQRFDNIAAAAQVWFEELMIAWIRYAIKKTDIHNVACAGGLFLNVKANKRIAEMPEVEDAFFYPACGDDGTPVGAALQAYCEYCTAEGIMPRKEPMTDIYYGPAYTDDEIRKTLRNTGWIARAEYYDEIDSYIGELTSKGKIVARFSGRMEWGPRALGNRSILADPRDLGIVRNINFAIKQRDFWMPFAPTILEERTGTYLIDGRSSPYMIMAFDTTQRRNEIIAAIHPYDYSCRPQSLNDSWNLGYRKTLETFENRTGVGGVLNTSFNLHGYPIVYSPSQAIWTFENSGLQLLAMGNYLIRK